LDYASPASFNPRSTLSGLNSRLLMRLPMALKMALVMAADAQDAGDFVGVVSIRGLSIHQE
jgi:hypothetical protein